MSFMFSGAFVESPLLSPLISLHLELSGFLGNSTCLYVFLGSVSRDFLGLFQILISRQTHLFSISLSNAITF